MTLVHILSPGFESANGQAFLFPILRYRRALRDRGIELALYTDVPEDPTACDAWIVESKRFRDRWENPAAVLRSLERLRSQAGRLLWFDTTDSTGTLQSQVLPFVDAYFKAQLLKDREQYRQSHYGERIYTHYYHTRFGVQDEAPRCSRPLERAEDVRKLRVSWNSGLLDHSLRGPWKAAMYRRWGWGGLLRAPRRWVPPSAQRPVPLTCRVSTVHRQATVRYQRERIRALLGERVPTSKVRSRRAYFAELERSRAMLSPFGWGEITFRDFEAFLSGCLVVKPSMEHLETWPDVFRKDTVLMHDWALDDLSELLDHLKDRFEDFLPLPEEAQRAYRQHLEGPEAEARFVDRFLRIVRG